MTKDLLLEIIDRYMTTYRPTPISLIRTKFPADADSFDQLLSKNVVEAAPSQGTDLESNKQDENEQYIPRMLAFEIVNDARRKQKALQEVGTFLRLLRGFVRFANRLEIGSSELSRFSRKNDVVAQYHNEWRPGLDVILAKDFPKYIETVSIRPGLFDSMGRSEFLFGVSKQIEGFENAELAWNEELESRRKLGLTIPPLISSTRRPGKPTVAKHSIAAIPFEPEFVFVNDSKLRALVDRDYAELQRLKRIEAMKSRFVLAGGLIEALLLDALLNSQSAAANTVAGRKERRSLEEWGLSSLLDAAVELKVITSSAQSFGHSVREFRNLVHPGLERRSNLRLETEEAQIAENVLAIVIRDLAKRHKQTPSSP
jgi:hypothetical protein